MSIHPKVLEAFNFFLGLFTVPWILAVCFSWFAEIPIEQQDMPLAIGLLLAISALLLHFLTISWYIIALEKARKLKPIFRGLKVIVVDNKNKTVVHRFADDNGELKNIDHLHLHHEVSGVYSREIKGTILGLNIEGFNGAKQIVISKEL